MIYRGLNGSIRILYVHARSPLDDTFNAPAPTVVVLYLGGALESPSPSPVAKLCCYYYYYYSCN